MLEEVGCGWGLSHWAGRDLAAPFFLSWEGSRDHNLEIGPTCGIYPEFAIFNYESFICFLTELMLWFSIDNGMKTVGLGSWNYLKRYLSLKLWLTFHCFFFLDPLTVFTGPCSSWCSMPSPPSRISSPKEPHMTPMPPAVPVGNWPIFSPLGLLYLPLDFLLFLLVWPW